MRAEQGDMSHLDQFYLGGPVAPMSRAEEDEYAAWRADYHRRTTPVVEQGDVACVHCGAKVFWSLPRPKDRCPECGKPVAEQGERHVHDWELITEEPITKVRSGYVRNWGNDYPVTWQTGVRRRFYCSICRETVEDSETFVHHVRLSA